MRLNIVTIKKLINLFLLFHATNLFAKPQVQLTRCLGRQELKIHKNSSNIVRYNLNQEFINFFTQNDDIKIQEQTIADACSKNDWPSIDLLMQFLENPAKIIKDYDKVDKNKVAKIIFESFKNLLRDIRINLGHKCVSENYKFIGKLEMEVFYLAENQGFLKTFQSSNEKKLFFNLLRNYQSAQNKCKSM
jgi:hypothetical protein